MDRNAAVIYRWTPKLEGHVTSRLMATSGRLRAEEASLERGVSEKEMTGTRLALAMKDGERQMWVQEMERERERQQTERAILVLDFLVLLPVGVRPGYMSFTALRFCEMWPHDSPLPTLYSRVRLSRFLFPATKCTQIKTKENWGYKCRACISKNA